MQHKTPAKERLSFKHCKNKKNKLFSIWGVSQKYLIHKMCMGFPRSFHNTSFSVSYPELGWGGWGLGMVVVQYVGRVIHVIY